MNARIAVYSTIAGCGWGLIALLLGSRAFGDGLWVALLASPFIGIAVGATTQRLFSRWTGWRRVAVALLSVYMGAILFALPIGGYELVAHNASSRNIFEVLVETVGAVLWGVTLTGYLIAFLPLAYFTHFTIEWLANN